VCRAPAANTSGRANSLLKYASLSGASPTAILNYKSKIVPKKGLAAEMLIAAKDLEETVESGRFLRRVVRRKHSGQHEEWIWTADLLVQCQEASRIES
jgi:hypothetical protein